MWAFEPACAGKVWMHISGSKSRLAAVDNLGDIPNLPTKAVPFAYVLHHGGPFFSQPVTRMDGSSLKALHEVVSYLPVLNRSTYHLAKQGWDLFPGRPQYVLCETAYFLKMPAEAAAYGLPYEMFDEGIRRYGGHGLLHAWVWRTCHKEANIRRFISIGLGDAPSLCAILDGEAVETSAGFSLCDGIPSMHSCGSLDPSIPILLLQGGYSPAEIEDILMCTSGWQALAGTPSSSLLNILAAEPGGLIWQMLRTHLLKELGKCMAALGGAQAIFFSGEEILGWVPFVNEICSNLGFCGIETGELRAAGGGIWRLEKNNTPCTVEMREMPRADMLAGWLQTLDERP